MANYNNDKEQLMNAAINRQTGLSQYEGDETIYEDILKSFAKNNSVTLEILKDAIGKEDLTLAHRTAHSLNGAAGTIGAERLAHTAHSIENALALMNDAGLGFIGGNAFGEQMTVLEKEFDAVFNELEFPAREKEADCNIPVSLDRAKMIALMDTLAPFLEIGDTKCLEYLDEIEAVFHPAAEGFRLFITQMEHYDFEQAYETITDIRRFLTP